VPGRSVAEFVQLAKQQPGKLSFGYTSATSRMPAEVLQQAAGIRLNGVPYKAGYQALPDLLEGRIDLLFTDLGAMTYVQAGKLHALAVADVQRSPLTPDVPTLQEAGIQGADLTYWVAAYAPARTPLAIVQRLHAALSKACESAEVRKAMAVGGTSPFVTPLGELQRFQAGEAQKWGRVIRAAGIQPE
jgi:tripartite-type tricarboxylate transporter receptor subunit TctC